ncbi:HNH endonuclease [Comamonas sp. JUb58]|uniref:HNH endonuclease n=1 Tax=Comamonas sp. JUb58 TaxID=2485114 RepID=UPI0010622AD9|nr:HNH endonuclease [Comamonas sp. JUb58]
MKNDIAISELRGLLRLNEETGELFWLVTRGKAKAGARAGTQDGQGYLTLTVNSKQHLAHRVVWALHHGMWPSSRLDHKDLNKSNNRPRNLRLATQSQNLGNTVASANNTSGHKGVCWHKQLGKWQAQIKVDGRNRYLGVFAEISAAKAAYAQAATAAWGNFARTTA